MSFHMTGAASSRMRMPAGLNTAAFTHTFYTKRLADLAGLRHLFNMARASGNYHDIILNAPENTPAHAPVVQANWATTQAKGTVAVPLNTWFPMAVQGSGANISLKWRSGNTVVTITVAQTAYTSEQEWWGDAGSNTSLYTGLFAHIRRFGAIMTDAEILAEWDSETPVRGANRLSVHSGGGGSVAAAVAGQEGTAFLASGALAYSADMPVFNTFTGVIISGEAEMPSEVSGSGSTAGTRVNRILWSRGSGLSNSVWNKQSNELINGAAVDIPSQWGTTQRIRIANANGGIYQLVNGVPAGKHLAYGVFKKVDTDFVAFRHMVEGFGSGAQMHFNLVTGAIAASNNFGTATDGQFGFKNIGNGWWLVWVAVTLPAGNRIVEFYPLVTGGVQQVALGRSLDVTGFQLEEGAMPTFPKLTDALMASRTLGSILVAVSPNSIAVGGLTNVVAQLLDSTGASPWDFHPGLVWQFSDPTKAQVQGTAPTSSNEIGIATLQLLALANGTTSVAASAYVDAVTQTGLISSTPAVLTVGGTSTARRVEILTEEGWYGVGGFQVGVYSKHSTQVFPTTKLFEVTGQQFEQVPAAGNLSRLLITPPSGVTLTLGQAIEVTLKNPNYNGAAVAGPSIFTATVI